MTWTSSAPASVSVWAQALDGGPGRKDVVYQQDSAPNPPPRRVGAGNVRPAFGGRELDLVPGSSHGFKFIRNGRVEPPSQASRQKLGLVEASPPAPGAVQRHWDDGLKGGVAQDPEHERHRDLLDDRRVTVVLQGVDHLLADALVPQGCPRAFESEVDELAGLQAGVSKAVGVPHLAQTGSPTAGSASKQAGHRTSLARLRQPTQRCG